MKERRKKERSKGYTTTIRYTIPYYTKKNIYLIVVVSYKNRHTKRDGKRKKRKKERNQVEYNKLECRA